MIDQIIRGLILPLINLTLMLISSNPFDKFYQSGRETNQDQEGSGTIGTNPIKQFSHPMTNKSTSQTLYCTMVSSCLTNAYHCVQIQKTDIDMYMEL